MRLPAPNAEVDRVIDRAAYVAALVGPMTTLPQVYQIYHSHSGHGISIAAWTGFTVYSAFWIVYGWVHRDLALTLANLLWTIFQGMVLVGAILWGGSA